MSVTYHDPCYLRLGQKVSSEPRRILRDISQYIEMKNADKCCGLGGTLGLFHPEISQKIGESKVKSIINSGADIVATGCPGCMLFIKDMLKKNGINREVLHTIQVLQKTL
jgi:glycolate oxidase iron-sulfur subunit